MSSRSATACPEDDFERTRRSIIDRLGDWSDKTAWERFYSTYRGIIYAFAVKSGLRHDEALEVVQETVLSIANQFRKGGYDPERGTFKSWLRNLTKWRIQDQFRKRNSEEAHRTCVPRGSRRETATLDRLPSPDSDRLEELWESEWQERALRMAAAEIRHKVSPRQYQIFECYVLKGWPVRRVCQDLGVHSAQVYLAKTRIQPLLKRAVQRLEEHGSL